MKKQMISLMMVVAMMICLGACGGDDSSKSDDSGATIVVPDLVGADEDTAKGVLSSKGIVSVIEHEHSDDVEKGMVCRTEPEAKEEINENDKVTLYVSDGPSYIESKSSTISWQQIDEYSGEDDWSFITPYIEDGNLYITCEATFAVDMTWKDDNNTGEGFGEASITDNFDKSVPVSIQYTNQENIAGEPSQFVIVVPLTDLDTDKPTDMNLLLYGLVYGEQVDINVSFTMTW